MRNDAAFPILLVLVFLSLGVLGVVNHEMWRDELQAWLIARDSSSIRNLFENFRYEGHPGLWYIILYLLSRFTHNPVAMQLSHLIIATGVIYIFARFSPFTKPQKALFSFGYFPFYEYAVISRNYAPGILCIFSFCALFHTRKKSYVFLSSILFLMANTSVYGAIIAMSLGLTLLCDSVVDEKIRRSLSARKWDLATSLLIFVLGIVSAVYQMYPPSGRGFLSGSAMKFHASGLSRTLASVWISYIPVPYFLSYHFWNTNMFIAGPMSLHEDIRSLLSLVLLAVSHGLLARKPVAFFTYLSGAFGILAFTHAVFFGKVPHHGHLFILFVACLWISSYYAETRSSNRLVESFADTAYRFGNGFVMVILYAHLAGGIIAWNLDLLHPFSASREASNFIKEQHRDNMLIVGSRDSTVSPLSGYLNRKIYYPESDRFGSFIVWKKGKHVDSRKLLEKVRELVMQSNMDILLVLNYRLRARHSALSISELSAHTKSIIPDETYYLYLVRRKDS